MRPSQLSESIANEILAKAKDKTPSGNVLRNMLVEAAEEGYQEGLLEGRH